MKIAFVVNVFPTLSETFILNQITGLVERGIEIDIIAGRVGETSKIHPDVIKFNLLDRTLYLDKIEKGSPEINAGGYYKPSACSSNFFTKSRNRF